ncbi:MAG: biopolymer transporter ExbD [Deltaproteobacteria bacterium]|nr:biopolymer transporter ExbD [Deltaproteobacteria bacterium]MCL5277398.1 biopolymer transporter ExbD [Deltaproteobacteria bacterium]
MRIPQLEQPKKARIEVINMIDVIFFLLVFFMVTSASIISMKGIKVDLPQASTASATASKFITITITKQQKLFIDGKDTNVENLYGKLSEELAQHPDKVVVINADRDSNYGYVVTIMDISRKAGATRFAIAAETK